MHRLRGRQADGAVCGVKGYCPLRRSRVLLAEVPEGEAIIRRRVSQIHKAHVVLDALCRRIHGIVRPLEIQRSYLPRKPQQLLGQAHGHVLPLHRIVRSANRFILHIGTGNPVNRHGKGVPVAVDEEIKARPTVRGITVRIQIQVHPVCAVVHNDVLRAFHQKIQVVLILRHLRILKIVAPGTVDIAEIRIIGNAVAMLHIADRIHVGLLYVRPCAEIINVNGRLMIRRRRSGNALEPPDIIGHLVVVVVAEAVAVPVAHRLGVAGKLGVEVIDVAVIGGSVAEVACVTETAGNPLVPAGNHQHEGILGRYLFPDQRHRRLKLCGKAKPLPGALNGREFVVVQPVVRLSPVGKTTSLTGRCMMPQRHRQGFQSAVGTASPAAVLHFDCILPRHPVLLQPRPVIVLIHPRPASAHREFLVQRPELSRIKGSGVAENERLSFPQEKEFLVGIPVFVRIHRGVQLLDMRCKGGGTIAAEENDLRRVNPLAPHPEPGIKQCHVPVYKHFLIGNVQEDEIHACRLQHIGVLAINPRIGVAVVAEVRLRPVRLAAPTRGEKLLHPVDAAVQVQLGVVLHVLSRADPAEEVKQSDIAVFIGVARCPVVRGRASQRIGRCPRGVVNSARFRLRLCRFLFLADVREYYVVDVASLPQRFHVQRKVASLIHIALIRFAQQSVRTVQHTQVRPVGIFNRQNRRLAANKPQGTAILICRNGLCPRRKICCKRHLNRQTARFLGHGHEAGIVKPEPHAAIGGNRRLLRVAQTQCNGTVFQAQIKGYVPLLQCVIIAEEDAGADGSGLAVRHRQAGILQNRGTGIRKIGIRRIGTDIRCKEIIYQRMQRAHGSIVAAHMVYDRSACPGAERPVVSRPNRYGRGKAAGSADQQEDSQHSSAYTQRSFHKFAPFAYVREIGSRAPNGTVCICTTDARPICTIMQYAAFNATTI